MYLEATFNGRTTDSDILEIHIEKTTDIDFKVKNIPRIWFTKKKDFYWNVFHNGQRVDANDYTGGEAAQLKVFKEHAGTKDKPVSLCVEVYEHSNSRNIIKRKLIKLSADSKITNTQWETTQCRNLELVPIYIDQEGLYGEDAIVKIYDTANTSKPITPTFTIKLNAGTNMVEWLAKNTTKEQKKFYYTISYKDSRGHEVLLFNGQQESMLLTVAAITNKDHKFTYPTNLTPITIYREEYFTQKYEPCKYSKIEVTYNGETKILFDETEQPVKTMSNMVLQEMIACAEKQEKIIFKIDSITNECRNVGTEDSHQSSIFDITELDTFNIEYTPKKNIKDQLEINLAYPYKHLEGKINHFEFFKSYFLDYPKIISFDLPIKTCRHSKTLTLNTYPDVAWAFHFQFGKGTSINYVEFYKGVKVDLFTGLKKEIAFIQNLYKDENLPFNVIEKKSTFFKVLLARISFFPLSTNLARDFLMMYLEITADKFSAGLHAYYKDQKGLQIIDYGKEYPVIPKTVIAGATAIWITIDVILLIITYGGTAAVTGASAASKASTATKVYKGAKKAYKYYRGYNRLQKLIAGDTQTVNKELGEGFEVKFADLSTYVSQQFVANPATAITELILERRFAATPLFSVGYSNEMTIGEFMVNLSGLGAIFSTGRFALGLAGSVIGVKNVVSSKRTNNPTRAAVKAIDVAEVKIVKNIDKVFKEHGLEAKIFIAFGAQISAHFTLKVNITQGLLNLYYKSKGLSGKDIKFENAIEAPFGLEEGILAIAKISAKATKTLALSKINYYIPDFLGINIPDVTTEVELKGMIKGSLHHEVVFKMLDGKAMYANNYIFSGMKGEILIKIKIKKEESDRVWRLNLGKKETNKEGKDKYKAYQFTLIEPFNIGSDALNVDEGINKTHFKT